MDIIRKMTVAVAASLLSLVLFTTGLSWSMFQVLGKADSIKNSLRESGIYDNVIGGALEQAQKSQRKDGGEGSGSEQGSIPIERDEVREVIAQSVPASEVQAQAEGVIDDVYAWLQGDSAQLDFTLDLTTIKTNLADGLSNYAAERVRELPACPASIPGTSDYDPFNASCRPQGVTADSIAKQLKQEILTGDFLKDTTFSANDIKNEQGESIGQQLQDIPSGYQTYYVGLYGMLGLTLLLALGVVFLSSHRRKGLKRAAIIFMSVGALSALMAWLSNMALKMAVNRFATSSEDLVLPLQQKALQAVYLLSGDLRTWWLGYGLLLLVLGGATLLTLHFVKPKHEDGTRKPIGEDKPRERPSTDDDATTTEETEKPATQPDDKPKSKPPKKLIQ